MQFQWKCFKNVLIEGFVNFEKKTFMSHVFFSWLRHVLCKRLQNHEKNTCDINVFFFKFTKPSIKTFFFIETAMETLIKRKQNPTQKHDMNVFI